MPGEEVFEVGAWVNLKHHAGTWRVIARAPEEGPPFWYTVAAANGDTQYAVTPDRLTRAKPPDGG